jgi:ubiquitin-protein ligase
MTELLDSASLLVLNNTTPITRRKRISAELKLFINKFESINLSFTTDSDSLIFTIIDNNIIPQFNTIAFVVPIDYPFRPPLVCINGQNYTSLIKMNNHEKLHILKSLTDKSCLCCNTVTCNDNWSPAMTFIDIISEIKHNFKLIDKILLQISFNKFKLLLHNDYKNNETRKNIGKNI